MLTITDQAAQRIHEAAREGNMETLPLRIAAKRSSDGSIEYGLGFDENIRQEDVQFTTQGINLVIAPHSAELLRDATLDFAEVEPGEHHFIFLNPNDPHYVPPKKRDGESASSDTGSSDGQPEQS